MLAKAHPLITANPKPKPISDINNKTSLNRVPIDQSSPKMAEHEIESLGDTPPLKPQFSLSTIDEVELKRIEDESAAQLKKQQSSLSIQEYFTKSGKFLTSSVRLFDWNGIKFRFHGFVIVMIFIDMIAESVQRKSISGAFYATLRNAMLLIMIFGIAFVRIQLFGKNQALSADPDYRDSAVSAVDNAVKGNAKQTVQKAENDDIEFESVLITYFGVVCKLKSICNSVCRKMKYFVFSAVSHCILGILCLIASNGEGGLFAWFVKLNFFCVVMCLLPVKGLDGGEMIKIYLKEMRGWNSVAITATLLSLSFVIIACVGIFSFFTLDIIAFCLAIICGIKVGQSVMDPNDKDMKTLKLMAKANKDTRLSDMSMSGCVKMGANVGGTDGI